MTISLQQCKLESSSMLSFSSIKHFQATLQFCHVTCLPFHPSFKIKFHESFIIEHDANEDEDCVILRTT